MEQALQIKSFRVCLESPANTDTYRINIDAWGLLLMIGKTAGFIGRESALKA